MTICAAAISQSSDSKHCIIAVCDRKVSMAELTAEGVAWKLQTIHRKWRAMFSGDNSSMIALIDAVKAEVASAKGDNVRSFARLCSKAYREERERILESEVLAEHDVNSYAEYLKLKDSDRDFFDALTEKMKKVEEKWNLLFFGFDKIARPHIFIITEYGKIQWCDAEGFAAIGSSAWAFWTALSRFGFNRYASRGETMWGVLSAKFAAESAEGVGEDTVFLLFKPTDRPGYTVPGLIPRHIKELREQWRKLPRIPDGTAVVLEWEMGLAESHSKLKVPNPLKGFYSPESRKKKSAK